MHSNENGEQGHHPVCIAKRDDDVVFSRQQGSAAIVRRSCRLRPHYPILLEQDDSLDGTVGDDEGCDHWMSLFQSSSLTKQDENDEACGCNREKTLPGFLDAEVSDRSSISSNSIRADKLSTYDPLSCNQTVRENQISRGIHSSERHCSDRLVENMLNDPEIIQQQQLMLQAIDNQRKAPPKEHTRDALQSDTKRLTFPEPNCKKDFLKVEKGQSDLVCKDLDPQNFTYDDREIMYGDGKRILVKGLKHAYDSIGRGTSILVQCPSCQATLQVDQSAKAVFCICCNEVFSIELAMSFSGTIDNDDKVAGIVQLQEINASSRKT